MSLKGKVAFVTGASEDPGSQVAVALAKAGAKVAVEGSAGVQERVLRTVETFGGDALPVRGDLAVEADIRHMLTNVEAIMGPVDILVNSTGQGANDPVCAAIIPGLKQRSGAVISIGAGAAGVTDAIRQQTAGSGVSADSVDGAGSPDAVADEVTRIATAAFA